MTPEFAKKKYNTYNRSFKMTVILGLFLFIISATFGVERNMDYKDDSLDIAWFFVTLGIYYYYKSRVYEIHHQYLSKSDSNISIKIEPSSKAD